MYALIDIETGETIKLYKTLKECQDVATEAQYCSWQEPEEALSLIQNVSESVVNYAASFSDTINQVADFIQMFV